MKQFMDVLSSHTYGMSMQSGAASYPKFFLVTVTVSVRLQAIAMYWS